MTQIRVLRPTRRALLAAAGATVLAACSGQTGAKNTPEVSLSGQPMEKELLLANWIDYADPYNLTSYSQQHGVKITQEGYGSQEELLSKLQAGGASYDVVVPSGDGLKQMIELGLAYKFDKTLLP